MARKRAGGSAETLPPQRVLLVGMMGSGKTAVGRIVAERLGWRYLDSDDQVRELRGMSSEQLLRLHGRDELHRAETEALRATLAEPPPLVGSVAGGMVLYPLNRRILANNGFVVWLTAPVEILARRAATGTKPLPSGDLVAELKRFEEMRGPYYAEVADLVVDVAEASPSEAADTIVSALRAR